MRVLVVGSGGREHALCWIFARSPLCEALFAAPGNAGIAGIATCRPVQPDDQAGLISLCKHELIDFVVIGPEVPLAAGLVDALEAHGIAAFGPSRAAAELESSKGFAKDFCARHGIPTAPHARVTDLASAHDEIRRRGAPVVVKADGLAAGKGVVVAHTIEQAIEAADAMMRDRRFGDAGAALIIEDLLDGEEVSFFALVDGETVLPLATAQDHKPVGEGDVGPNTGGMGAFSPAPAVDGVLEATILDRIIRPTARGMAAEGRPFKGVLFAGVILTADGPQLLEFNVRFGDPECEAIMRRLDSDLLPALVAVREGRLDMVALEWLPQPAIAVVLAANGYPGDPLTGTSIRGLEAAKDAAPDIEIFHAGTAARDGAIVSAGGRVLVVTALGSSVSEAQARAYQAINAIDWPQGFCRRDIGWRAVLREQETDGI